MQNVQGWGFLLRWRGDILLTAHILMTCTYCLVDNIRHESFTDVLISASLHRYTLVSEILSPLHQCRPQPQQISICWALTLSFLGWSGVNPLICIMICKTIHSFNMLCQVLSRYSLMQAILFTLAQFVFVSYRSK